MLEISRKLGLDWNVDQCDDEFVTDPDLTLESAFAQDFAALHHPLLVDLMKKCMTLEPEGYESSDA